jgi:uncharacterized protein YcgI (DUF1989 family)
MSTTASHASYDIPGGAAISVVVAAHDVARLTALGSGGNASMLLYAYPRTHERLNVPDTLKAQMSSRVITPMVLMSHLGNALMSVTGSSLDWHDALSGHSTDGFVQDRYGESSYAVDRNSWRQSARRGLLDELWKHDLGVRDLHACVNWFSKVVPADDDRGTLTFVADHAVAGDWVELRAEQDVLMVLSTSVHPLDPAAEWPAKAMRLELSHGAPPGPEDPSALFRDEPARALQLAGRVTA